MFNKFLKWMEENRDYGLTVFLAYDPISQKPSITLLMTYVSFILSVVSVVLLHFQSLLMGAVAALTMMTITTIFYLIRSLNKAKINLEEKSFELENSDKDENEK